MIRATNTIKHLDVRPCLFEEREGGREGGRGERALKKSRPQQGVVRGDQTLTLNLRTVLENEFSAATACMILCMYLCVAVLYISVFDAVSCVVVHRSSV